MHPFENPTMVKVVVIDDSPQVQRSLVHLLGTVPGIEVAGCADDVASALCLIEDCHPDVVVLDVDLRHGDKGIDVLRHVTRDHPGVRVVAMSNFTWHAIRNTYLAAGAEAYFDKSMEFTLARDWIAALVPPPPSQPL
ncbi:MAG: response regulator transcription factor [Rhizobacter sp.]|nr:response regulator transcription factor [Rhizobacter sp.]